MSADDGASPSRLQRLVYCDAAGSLHLEAHAVSWLRSSLKALPIGVLAVTGPMRTGKSSLMNELLDGAGGVFRTSAALESCTKGLWAYALPAPAWLPALKGGTLLLLDTEGLGSVDAPSRDPQRLPFSPTHGFTRRPRR